MQAPYAVAALCLLLAWYWWAQRRRRVLLLDFACYKPPGELSVTKEKFMQGLRDVKVGISAIRAPVYDDGDINPLICPSSAMCTAAPPRHSP